MGEKSKKDKEKGNRQKKAKEEKKATAKRASEEVSIGTIPAKKSKR